MAKTELILDVMSVDTPPAPAGLTTSDWESTAYPSAAEETKLWLREQRGLIHAFLSSDYGQTEARRHVVSRRNENGCDTHFFPMIVRRALTGDAMQGDR